MTLVIELLRVRVVRRTINELEVSAEVKCCHTSAIFIITHIFYWCWAAAGEKTKCFYNFSFLCLAGVMCRYSVVGRDVVSRCDRGQVGLTWPMFQYSRSNSSNMTTFLLPSSPADPVYLLCIFSVYLYVQQPVSISLWCPPRVQTRTLKLWFQSWYKPGPEVKFDTIHNYIYSIYLLQSMKKVAVQC